MFTLLPRLTLPFRALPVRAALILSLCLLAVSASATVSAQQSDRTISGVALSSDAPGALTVQWTAPGSEPNDYRVNYARADEVYPSYTLSYGNAYPTGPSLALSGLDEGVKYKVRVRARYSDGSGPWSGDARLTVMAAAPAESERNSDEDDNDRVSRQVDDPHVTVTFTINDDTITEGGSTVGLRVTIDVDPERDLVIPLRITEQGGADASDYSAVEIFGEYANGNITFTSGGGRATFISIEALDDGVDDDGESLLVEVLLPEGVIARGATSYTVEIIDNDNPEPEDDDCKNRNTASGADCYMDVGESFTGAIGYGGDIDAIYVDGIKPYHTVQVHVIGSGLPDPYVYGVASDDDSAGGRDARAEWRNPLSRPVTAVFYVRASHLKATGANDTGGYDVLTAYSGAEQGLPDDHPGRVTVTGELKVDEAVTASLSDPDGGVSNVSWQWEVFNDYSPQWNAVSDSKTYMPRAKQLGMKFRVVATYSDTHRPERVTMLEVGRVQRSAPRFTDTGPVSRSLLETAWPGAIIGDPIFVRDPQYQWLQFSVDGPDAEYFAVDSRREDRPSGPVYQARLREGFDYSKRLDFENPRDGNRDNVYHVDVVARNVHHPELTSRIRVNVTLLDKEEEGKVSLSPAGSIYLHESVTATLSDPDGGVRDVRWQWQTRDERAGGWGPFYDIDGATSASHTFTEHGSYRVRVIYTDRRGAGKAVTKLGPFVKARRR